MGSKLSKVFLYLVLYFFIFQFFSVFFNNFKKLEKVVYEKELFFKAVNFNFSAHSNQIIKILAVDFKAIQKLSTLPEFKKYSSRWPWNRRIFAKIIDYLRRAKVNVVGVDFFFNLDSSRSLDPEQDKVLAQSIKQNGRIVLAGFIDNMTRKFIKPIPMLEKVALDCATVDMPVDSIDNTVAKCRLLWPSKDGPIYSFDYIFITCIC
jgi:CHASE2 domain-containing sensor protein